ncbi:MAG: chromate transporter [Proteobacteria bacterium]|nr:chromate transporter [Pseudomonadota bacterium]
MASLVGLLLPSTILIVILGSFYLKYKDLPGVKGLLKGVRPVMVSLFYSSV